MNNWQILRTFDHPQQAHILVSKLESMGIRCQLQDELTVQSYHIISNAIGGVKLWVHNADLAAAQEMMIAAGFGDTPEGLEAEPSRLQVALGRFPLIGSLPPEVRIWVILGGLGAVAVALYSYWLLS